MTAHEGGHPHELVSAYLDGELAPTERATVERHLRECESCSVLAGDLRRLSIAVAAETPPPVPAGLAARISRRLHPGDQARSPRRWSWMSPLPLGAVASLASAALIWVAWEVYRVPAHVPGPDMVARSIEAPGMERARPEAVRRRETPPFAEEPVTAPGKAAARPEADVEAKRRTAVAGPSTLQDRQVASPPPGSSGEAVEPQVSGTPQDAAPPAAASPPRMLRQAAEDVPSQDTPVGQDRRDEATRGTEETGPAGLVSGAASEVVAADLYAKAGKVRTLEFISPLYRAEISEDGLLTVRAEGYECTVSVPRTALPMGGGPPAGPTDVESRAGRVQDLPTLDRLFALASAPRLRSARKASPGPRKTAFKEMDHQSIILRDRDGMRIGGGTYEEDASEVPPSASRELGELFDRLIRERYRPILENRCGPLPDGLRPVD